MKTPTERLNDRLRELDRLAQALIDATCGQAHDAAIELKIHLKQLRLNIVGAERESKGGGR